MGADPLSDVLRSVRLTGATYFLVQGSSPWVAEAPAARAIADRILPGVAHVLEYHAITAGACFGGIVGEEPVRLEEGDVIVFPHGDPHVLSSAPGMRAPPILEIYRRDPADQLPTVVTVGGGGPERAEIVCGFLGCDVGPSHPLVATLPRMLRARDRDEGGLLRSFMQVAVEESRRKRLGGEGMLARMSELMFIEVVRRYLESLPAARIGWLAGLRDEHVGRALALLHERPAQPWSLEALARRTGLSRSALAERFTSLVGVAPMRYLARWRMQLAAGLLADGSANVAAVAYETGYASEAAFSRAFKRELGIPPAEWRRQREGGVVGPAA